VSLAVFITHYIALEIQKSTTRLYSQS